MTWNWFLAESAGPTAKISVLDHEPNLNQVDRRLRTKATFDLTADRFDCHALRFFSLAADLLPGIFRFRGNESVLDVAAGTGISSLAMAAHLPSGCVIAVDISGKMLAKAADKCRDRGISNISFHPMDMAAMSFPEHTFDAANCSFALYFHEDMAGVLRHIASTVKPGGVVVTTNLRVGSFSRFYRILASQAKVFGLPLSPPTWLRVGTAELNATLFERSGLTGISVSSHDIGYCLDDAAQWWDVLWNSGFRGIIEPLDSNQLARFRSGYLAEVEKLQASRGLRLDVEVLITRGYKAVEASDPGA